MDQDSMVTSDLQLRVVGSNTWPGTTTQGTGHGNDC